MELFCTSRGIVTVTSENVECAVFMLKDLKLEPGAKIEQRRAEGDLVEVVATWEFVEQTPKTIILKGDKSVSIELADGFYAEAPAAEIRQTAPQTAPQISGSMSRPNQVLVFAGKNWKLASHKKWVPMSIELDESSFIEEFSIGGKTYYIYRLKEGFAAKEKAS